MKPVEYNKSDIPERSHAFKIAFWAITVAWVAALGCRIYQTYVLCSKYGVSTRFFLSELVEDTNGMILSLILIGLYCSWCLLFLFNKLFTRVFYRKDRYWRFVRFCMLPFILLAGTIMDLEMTDAGLLNSPDAADIIWFVFFFPFSILFSVIPICLIDCLVSHSFLYEALFVPIRLPNGEKYYAGSLGNVGGYGYSSGYGSYDSDDYSDYSWGSSGSYIGSHGEFDISDRDRAYNEDIEQFRSSDKGFDAEEHFGWEHDLSYHSEGYDD